MKIRVSRNISIYSTCIVVCVALMFVANWLFNLPSVIAIIGDNKTWIPIAADSILAAMIFIAGNWVSNADRLRTKLNDKKADFEIIRAAVERLFNALNIKRRQQYFILALDPAMNCRDLLHEIMLTQQEIDEATAHYLSIHYLVESENEYLTFKESSNILSTQFQIVLDGLLVVVNKWCDTLSKIEQTKLVIEMNNGSNERLKFATLYRDSCKELTHQKSKFLETYNKQEDLLNRLLNELRHNADALLQAEQNIIMNINKKLQ